MLKQLVYCFFYILSIYIALYVFQLIIYFLSALTFIVATIDCEEKGKPEGLLCVEECFSGFDWFVRISKLDRFLRVLIYNSGRWLYIFGEDNYLVKDLVRPYRSENFDPSYEFIVAFGYDTYMCYLSHKY